MNEKDQKSHSDNGKATRSRWKVAERLFGAHDGTQTRSYGMVC